MAGRPRARWFVGLALVGCGSAVASFSACQSSVPNPYATTGASASSSTGFGGAGGAPVDPELGGPCVDDTQCNDSVDCTFDACDQSLGRCRFKTDDSLCQNTVFCDGVERCDQKIGCQPGPPKSCDDANVCTIDTCIEASQSCTNVPRDADGDGDPDAHCGGGDCNDFDPLVSSLLPEICGNQIDDNCNGQVDEAGCISPANDTCIDALAITVSGVYQLDTNGAAFDYATTCTPMATPLRDVVAAVELPAGLPVDVIATARSQIPVSLAIAAQCGQAGTELSCGGSFTAVSGGKIAKTRARGLGSATGASAYPIYVTTVNGAAVSLDVEIVAAEPAPDNETCGTAETITPGTPVVADLIGAASDVDSACAHPTGDLVYAFTLAAPSDVDIYGSSVDGNGQPSLSLRDAACSLLSDEIACDVDIAPHIFRHSLPAGDYYISVASTAPTSVSVDVALSPPTSPPPDDNCATAPPISPNHTLDVSFANHQDDLSIGCIVGAVDVAYDLSLGEASDVLLVQRLGQGDSAAVELVLPACAATTDVLACTLATHSPGRALKRNVSPGDYRVVAESTLAVDQQLTAFVRPTGPATIATFADACADALVIPSGGGFFQGNTANAVADFPAGCDNAGGAVNGAPDQLLRLDLTAQKRVIFDMTGSGYKTLLDVRSGSTCPGDEVQNACSTAVANAPSYLDLTLDAGTYYVQVDGLGGDAGPWFLDVFVVDP